MTRASLTMTHHRLHLMMIVQIVIHQMIMIRRSSIKGRLVESLICSEMQEKHLFQRLNKLIITSASTAPRWPRTCTSAINLATKPIITNVRIAKRISQREWSMTSFASLVTELSATSTGLKNVSSLPKIHWHDLLNINLIPVVYQSKLKMNLINY